MLKSIRFEKVEIYKELKLLAVTEGVTIEKAIEKLLEIRRKNKGESM